MTTQLLRVEGLLKSFGAFQALERATLSVSVREIIGVIGPNGTSKMTLLECAAGLLTPTPRFE